MCYWLMQNASFVHLRLLAQFYFHWLGKDHSDFSKRCFTFEAEENPGKSASLYFKKQTKPSLIILKSKFTQRFLLRAL